MFEIYDKGLFVIVFVFSSYIPLKKYPTTFVSKFVKTSITLLLLSFISNVPLLLSL